MVRLPDARRRAEDQAAPVGKAALAECQDREVPEFRADAIEQ